MESLLNYYYGINVRELKYKTDYYIVETGNGKYILSELYGNIDEVQKIINILNQTNIKYHLLVLTKDNNLYITYEEKNFCLLKVRCDLNAKIPLLAFNQIKIAGSSNWSEIWSQRIDYYESQVEEVIKEPNIKYALQYYIGLTEIAIYYYNNLENLLTSNISYSLSHKKITSPINPLEYYNPLNMLIDIEIRDIAEYIKSAFFNEILSDYEILHIIDNINFSESSANYFYLRLLYPSYFFNLYDEYIETNNLDNNLFLCIKKSSEFESLLSKIYSRLSMKNSIKIYLWFIKVQHL